MEIEAEIAAQARNHPKKQYGCIRLVVWAMPTFLYWVLLIFSIFGTRLLNPLLNKSGQSVVFWLLSIGLLLGLGCYDASFTESVRRAMPSKRIIRIFIHTCIFSLAQVLIVSVIYISIIYIACSTILK